MQVGGYCGAGRVGILKNMEVECWDKEMEMSQFSFV